MPESQHQGLPPLREVMAEYGLTPRRRLGQNFLLDLNLTRRIVRAAGALEGVTVIEIGPGPGGLTRALLESPASRVVAIERDERCIEALLPLATAYPERLMLVEGDALEQDAARVARTWQPDARLRIVANLPYNVATRLLLHWLSEASAFELLVLMFQKEVAERLAAGPGSAAYGRLSVITQWLCQVETVFDITPRAFVPPPKVWSTVVRLTPRHRPLAEAPMAALENVTRAAFGQRRKMLRSALKPLGVAPMALLERAGIAPTARAEELDIPEFCALARALAEMDAQVSARRAIP